MKILVLNSKLGEVYIIGLRKEKKRKTKLLELTSKKNGILRFKNLSKRQYLDPRSLMVERDLGKNFKDLENVVFIFLVTKKWPESNYINIKFKKVGFF